MHVQKKKNLNFGRFTAQNVHVNGQKKSAIYVRNQATIKWNKQPIPTTL